MMVVYVEVLPSEMLQSLGILVYLGCLERLANNSLRPLLIYMQYDDCLRRGTAVGDASVSWYVSVLGMP